MLVKELIELLGNICKTHPEAKEADVWFYRNERAYDETASWPVRCVGYDRRHRPNRVKLED